MHYFMRISFQRTLLKIVTVTVGFLPMAKLTVKQEKQELLSKKIGDLLRGDYIIPDVNFFHAGWSDEEKHTIENRRFATIVRKDTKSSSEHNEHFNRIQVNLQGGIGDEEGSRVPPGVQYGVVKRNKKLIKRALIQYRLMPQFLSDLGTIRDLQVEFKSTMIANYGNNLSPFQTREAPYLQWSADPECYYTAIMINYDAPGSKYHYWREWLHWMVVNIPRFDVEAGDTLTQYVGPHPGADTGFHRYIFVLYNQGNKTIKFNEPLRLKSDLISRRNFSVFKFAEKYKLEQTPWAFNFIRAQYCGTDANPYDEEVTIVTEDVDGQKNHADYYDY
ncbi:unnamed protein product [Bemisia tabaci]|uniref:Phosphatidylethanolamine-binding protein n=1 Tax=Bemisia tabaci TaxID=7038 RepID=A0A9P0AFI0_BEMTA|nr:unnamed protein product [Bemisia tabaci]